MSKQPQREYYPGPVPHDAGSLREYLSEELYRISQALKADPVSVAVLEAAPIPIGPTEAWANPFIGDPPGWQVPGGIWDQASGTVTVPANGLYQFNAQLSIDAFGSGNKEYFAGLRLLRDGVEQVRFTDGGTDNMPLSVSLVFLGYFTIGEVLTVESAAVHENQTGTVAAATYWSMLRVDK